MTYKYDCKLFTGYKPCRHKRPCAGCNHYQPAGSRVLLVSLEAMGAVLRSTCLLAPIKRQHPDSHLTWLTLPPSAPLLANNPLIDRILPLKPETLPVLDFLEFDALYCVDKSMAAGAIAERVQAKQKFGFGLTKEGAIRPLTKDADYQYAVGLDDDLKFYKNEKPETQQITESMGLSWKRDPYILNLTEDEQKQVQEHRDTLLHSNGREAAGVLGFNTGCSLLYPYKRFTVERCCEVVAMWREAFPRHTVALLGGPEDQARQDAMKEHFANDPWVVNTPCREGLRTGIQWMAATDLVLSGCSLGMHIAIALKKPTIAWFGVSCHQEIDLYDRGEKLLADVSCSPCWRRSCDQLVKCYDQVSPARIGEATSKLLCR